VRAMITEEYLERSWADSSVCALEGYYLEVYWFESNPRYQLIRMWAHV